MYLNSKILRTIQKNTVIQITGSKSETNRLLLLQALYPEITIENQSNSDDATVMKQAIASKKQQKTIDIHHAGTAMRFLTAYFATNQGSQVVLTGSQRMKERPIKILVDALKHLGANIQYTEKEGFPPIAIQGKTLIKNEVVLPATISSQYISALLLIAPKLPNGLTLHLEGEITSLPYIKMTLALLSELGASVFFEGNTLKINPLKSIQPKTIQIESDWSSASYWYSRIAFSEIGTEITLSSFKKNSKQGDAILATLYEFFGVFTNFNPDNSICISKQKKHQNTVFKRDLTDAPDIAQTLVVTCFGLQIPCELTGLHTLKIKETDRLVALQNEITKLGGTLQCTNSSLALSAATTLYQNATIATYQDHRMAMAFAPIAQFTPLYIENPEVVSKSYPTFWDDFLET